MTLSRDYLRKKVGWCPDVPAGACRHANRSGDVIPTPASGGVLPARKFSWSQRFRNWVLLQALLYTALISLFLPSIVTGAYLSFFIFGMAIATLVFFLIATRLWRHYNDVLAKGHLEASETESNIVLYFVLSAVILPICFEILVLLGYISGIDFLVLPAVMVGLSIIPWYVLLLVIIWESRTGCRLYFDRKDENASMYVVRGN
jgi:small-conductance mechanosensitive channel